MFLQLVRRVRGRWARRGDIRAVASSRFFSRQWYLSRYRDGFRLILATGEQDICLAQNLRLHSILDAKGIPHWLDVWGGDSKHDWPLWIARVRKFFQ